MNNNLNETKFRNAMEAFTKVYAGGSASNDQPLEFTPEIIDNLPSEQRRKEAAKHQENIAKFGQLIGTSQGRNFIAEVLTTPLRHYLDYAPINRLCMVVEEFPAAVEFRKDFDLVTEEIGNLDKAIASVVADEGVADQMRLYANRLVIPQFNIGFTGIINYETTMEVMYNTVDRMKDKAPIAMGLQEDYHFLALLDAVSTASNPQINYSALAARPFLGRLRKMVDQHRLPIYAFLGGPSLSQSVTAWRLDEAGIDLVNEVNRDGYLAQWGNVKFIVTNKIEDYDSGSATTVSDIYCLTEPRFLGWLPIRQSAKVQMFNYPDRYILGVAAFERIGMTVWNSLGVAKGTYRVDTTVSAGGTYI